MNACLERRLFSAEDPQALLRQILTRELEPLHRRKPAALPCLQAVYDGLLAKEPEARMPAQEAARQLAAGLSALHLPPGTECLEAFLRDPEGQRKILDAAAADYWERQAQTEEAGGNPARARRYRIYAGRDGNASPTDGVPSALPGRSRKKAAGLAMAAAGAVCALSLMMLKDWSRIPGEGLMPGNYPAIIRDTAYLKIAPVPPGESIPSPTSDAGDVSGGERGASWTPPSVLKSKAPAGVPLQSGKAFLRVLTRPPHVRILVDGKEIGTSPLNHPIRVPAGSRQVELLREDCEPLREQVDFPAGDTLELRRELTRLSEGVR
jgi:hypothetical protein